MACYGLVDDCVAGPGIILILGGGLGAVYALWDRFDPSRDSIALVGGIRGISVFLAVWFCSLKSFNPLTLAEFVTPQRFGAGMVLAILTGIGAYLTMRRAL
jgi:hypothetical protein